MIKKSFFLDVSQFIKSCLFFRSSMQSKSELVRIFPATVFSIGNHCSDGI